MANNRHSAVAMLPRTSQAARSAKVETLTPAEGCSLPPALAKEVVAEVSARADAPVKAVIDATLIATSGMLNVPIKVAMLEPLNFFSPIRLSYKADGESGKLIRRAERGLNTHNVRKGSGKHVDSIAAVVEYLLDHIADAYDNARETIDEQNGMLTVNIPLALAIAENEVFARPVTVYFRAHQRHAKTLLRLRLGLDAHHLQLNGGRHFKSYESVVKYLFEQVQMALAGDTLSRPATSLRTAVSRLRPISADSGP